MPRLPAVTASARSLRTWLVDLAAQTGLAAAVTLVVFRVWAIPLGVPFSYTGDALTTASVVQGITERGWLFSNPRLGAPTGYQSYDFPLGGESLHYLVIKVMSLFTSNPFALTNAYFLLSFVLVALSALVVLRLIGINRWLAHALALVYAFAPYHFLRGTEHLTLAAYWSVPFGCLLCWWLLSDDLPFVTRRDDRLRLELRSRRVAGVLVCAVLVGLGGAYYAAFTLILLATAGVLAWFQRRDWRPVIATAFTGGAVLAVIVISTLPSLAYRHSHGTNPEAGRRPLSEQDIAPLRPVQMLTPIPDHRLAPARDVADELLQAPSNSEPSQFLGVVAGAGLLIGLVAIGAGLSGRRSNRWLTEAHIGVFMVVLILFGVSGGFDWITGLFGLSEIRAWGRVSVVIAFWALVVVGLVGTRAIGRWSTRVWLAPVMAAALVIVALVDQVPRHVADSRNVQAEFLSDQRYYQSLEAMLPARSMVFQLPWSSYPEAPPVNGLLAPAELLRPSLQTQSLRWSFGGMRGRAADWEQFTAAEPTPEMVDAIAAVGYSGLLIDRAGYADHGQALEAELAQTTGVTPMVSEGKRLAFYDLRSYAAQLRARLGDAQVAALADRELHRPTFWFDDGFEVPVADAAGEQHWAKRHSDMVVWNRGDGPWTGSITMDLRTLSPVDDTVSLRLNGANTTVTLKPGEWTPVSVPATLAPGRTNLSIQSSGPGLPGDIRNLHVIVRDAVAEPAS